MTRLLFAAALLLGSAAPALGGAWNLDPGHAQVAFHAEHFGVARMGGWFTGVTGTAVHDPADITKSKVEVQIDATTLTATAPQREGALKSGFFLDVETYPEIRFASTGINKGDDGLVMTGDLTIRDVTRKVTFPFTMKGPRLDPMGGQRFGIVASLVVDRQDYGIAFDRKMKDGTPLVGNEVRIDLWVEFIEARPADGGQD